MTGKDRLETHNAIIIRWLNSSKERRVPAAVRDVLGFVDATVDTCCVGVLDVDVEGGDAEAGVDV